MSWARPKYFGRVPFWLDLMAAISLIGDIPFFASELLPSGFAAARAGRAARAGTKAGRLVRLTRLTRVQKHLQGKGRKSVVEELGTEEEKRIIAQARAKMQGQGGQEDSEKAGAIANQISTRTIKKVIIGVLVMLLAMPYLEADRPDASKFKQLVQLHNVAENTTTAAAASMNKNACYTTALVEQSYLLNLTLHNYMVSFVAASFAVRECEQRKQRKQREAEEAEEAEEAVEAALPVAAERSGARNSHVPVPVRFKSSAKVSLAASFV